MQDQYNSYQEPRIVQTDLGSKDGQVKCPKCGATDISTNVLNGALRCNFCRHEFALEKIEGMVEDLNELEGQVIGSGATDIVADTNDVLTFKCSSCGAEVVIDTASSASARCHWCRNTLSVNQQIPNGSIPDAVLPFHVSLEEAKLAIEKFVSKRKFFAHPQFKREFTTNNIMGVYFPYMLVDVNAHANFSGEGEHQTRKYYKGSGSSQEVYYDADLFHVEREFDVLIHGLSVESNSDRLNTLSSDKTNNVIHAIMPFDVENCVKYHANYLKGYTSERRDVNVSDLRELVHVQASDVARFAANDTLTSYDRGVAWSHENFDVKGEQWKAAYLPVWLYSYQEVRGNQKFLHYVAVNARTKETMGSVPIHMPKLIGMSFLVEFFGILGMLFVDFDYDFLFLLSGFLFFLVMFFQYRNVDARHAYESETKSEICHLRKVDQFLSSRKGLSNATMRGANNKKVSGQGGVNQLLKAASGEALGSNIVNHVIDHNAVASFIRDNIDKNGGVK